MDFYVGIMHTCLDYLTNTLSRSTYKERFRRLASLIFIPLSTQSHLTTRYSSRHYAYQAITRRDAVQQKVPSARIRLLDAVAAKQEAPFAAVWREAGAYII